MLLYLYIIIKNKNMSKIDDLEINNNPLDSLIEEINSTIFSKEEWVDNEFYKIPEMTYSYEKLWKNNEFILNKTLFSNIGWLNVSEFNISNLKWKKLLISNSWGIVEKKILDKIYKIEEYLKLFNWVDSWGDEVLKARKEIIEWGLKENITFLNIALEWLDFEKEKAILGLHFDWENNEKSDFYISSEKREEKLRKIDKLNTQIFWEKLSNNKENIETSLDYLFEKFQNYKEKRESNKIEDNRLLLEEEEERYNYYINKLQWLSLGYNPKIREKPKSVLNPDLKNVEIDITTIKDILNHWLVAHDKYTWNMWHRAYFDKNITGFTDTTKWLWIPDNEKLKFKSAFDVNRLQWHENEQHSISQVSHEELVWNIRWAQNLEVVEWSAMLWEELYQYWENMYKDWVDLKIIDLEKISTVQSFPKTIMEEILTDKEFLDFLELQNKIEPDKMPPLDRYLRFKRTGFQRKDITYTTWKIKVAKYYNKIITWEIEWDFSDLYLWKIWFKDIENLKILKHNLIKSNDELEDSKKIKLPENLFFAEVTNFWIEQKLNWNKITWEWFYTYLQKKYPSLNVTQKKIDSITFWFKKQLLGVIDTIVNEINIYNERMKVKAKSKRILKSK